MVAAWASTLGFQNWLPDRCLVSLFSSFLFLSPAGKAYAPEFYYDTYNPLWQNRPRVYSYSLQWTQMNPDAVDRILAYRLGIRQVRTEIRSCRMCLLGDDLCEGCRAFILFYFISFFFFFPLFFFCESELCLLLLEGLLPSCRSSPLPLADPGN